MSYTFKIRRSIGTLSVVIVATLLILAFSAATVRAQQSPAKIDAAPEGNAERGKESFKRFGCSSCHGYTAQGGTGARLAQNPITFPAFVRYVNRPKRSMPPFGDQLKDSDLKDIFAFIKSVPPSPPPKSIPLLNE